MRIHTCSVIKKEKENENTFRMKERTTIKQEQQTRQVIEKRPGHSLYTHTHNYTYNFMITTFTHPPAYSPSDQQTGNVPIMVGCNGRYRNIKKVLRRSLVFAIAVVIANFFFINKGWGQGSQTFNTPGSTTFTVPAGVTSITVSAWGGGGAGGGVTGGNPRAGGGGEGGSFVRGTITVIPGTQYTVVVGNGGTGSTGTGTSGGASSFGGAALFNAIGGGGGAAGITGSTFGAGGNTTNTGNVASGTSTSSTYGGAGGSGTNASTASSGGGGGSAGAGGDGGNGGSPLTGGTAGLGSGSPSDPGIVGATGRGSQNDGVGIAGGNPGAGGSGARNANNNTTYAGGAGGNGQVIVRWTCPAATISYPLASYCSSLTSALVTITGSPGGTFSATPAGLSINSSTGEINPSASTLGNYTVHYQIAAGGNGCTTNVDATFAVSITTGPSTTFTKNDLSCFQNSTGQIVITGVGGTAPYTYSIDNGTNYSSPVPTGTFNNLSAGTYKVRVKDNNGCESKSVQ